MSARAWLSFAAITMAFGVLIGWSCRTLDLNYEYILTQIQLQDAEARFFKMKTDQLIQQNRETYSRERKPIK